MAEVIINKEDIETIIRSYKTINSTFQMRSFTGTEIEKLCVCFINSKECKLKLFFKAKSVKIIPIGKNVEECNLLVSYIESKGYSTKVESKTVTFNLSEGELKCLLNFVDIESNGIIICNKIREDLYEFVGYNGDNIKLHFYSSKNKAMIQGRPFQVFSIIMTYFAEQNLFSFDEIVEYNNVFIGINAPSLAIRTEMQNALDDAYLYLDEALLKSISGSFSMFRQKSSEDFTGCLTGLFKALEGYLKKLLTQKYSYKIEKCNSFNMFHKESNGLSKIDNDTNITTAIKSELNKLYRIYGNKRNVYLHTTVDPSQTKIIDNIKEAKDIADEILFVINESYKIIFK